MDNPSQKIEQNTDFIKRASKKARKKSRRKNKLSLIFVTVVLLASAGAIATFAWIGFLIVFEPYNLGWVNDVLPEWAQIPFADEKPQTLTEIDEKLATEGEEAGETLSLEDNSNNSILLPVFQEDANCESDCQHIMELRIYQSSEKFDPQSSLEQEYRLTSRLPINGLEQSFVVAPLTNIDDGSKSSSTTLPLTEVQRFQGSVPSSGTWYYLRGQHSFGNNAIAYGQILYYDRSRTQLKTILSWTSPNGQLPQWQKVDGEIKELVVNQTVGLEPQLQLYQLKNTTDLTEISLQTPAFQDPGYKNALLIARSGLWTPAFKWLEFIEKQQKGKLNPAAKAQIELIRLNSEISKTQADKDWASPSQQVLADLIDGRWGKALDVFQASQQNTSEVTALLKADEGRLWNRVQAALKVNPNRSEVQAWGALILAAQHGQNKANSWLQQQPQTKKTSLTYIQKLLKQMAATSNS